MADISRIMGIKDLKLQGVVESMSDSAFGEYLDSLKSFTELYPSMEKNLRDSLGLHNLDLYGKNLRTTCDRLKKIHADELAETGLAELGGLQASNPEKMEAFLTDFLTSVSSLSIDIQMAEHGNQVNPTAEGNETPEVVSSPENKRSILAVDDTAFFLSTLKALIQGETNYKLTCVNSGVAALRFLMTGKPDLFILDIEMPEMNGYELARKIREAKHTAPIIFLTGNSSKDYVLKAIQAGAADFIVKPINKEHVLEKINKFIEG